MKSACTTATICAVATLLCACGSGRARLRSSEQYYERANYYQAYKEAELARDLDPDDREIDRQYWKTRTASMLERGQELVFFDRDREALQEFERVLVTEPENRIALRWIEKTKGKLADAAAQRGVEALMAEDLEGALLAFNEALSTVQNQPEALAGLKSVEEIWTKRRGKAKDAYLEGVRALAERLFAQTEYRMLIALRNDPGLEEAKAPQRMAQERLAERRYEEAQAIEKARRFGAALKEYTDIATSAPDLPGLTQRIEAMKVEVDVEAKMREAELMILRGQHDAATEILKACYEKTVASKGEVSEVMLLARERGFEARYLGAKDLELRNDYAGALTAYQAIATDWPGYRDVAARISGLSASIELATKAYDSAVEAEGKGDLKRAIDQFTEALLYHPGFRDAERRIRELRATLQSKG